MVDIFDRDRIIDCMFDPITASILAEFEDGEKESSFLANKFSISEDELFERFSYLIKCEFIYKSMIDGRSFLSANNEKLSQIIENGDTFSETIEGLEKLDSYLN